MSGREDISEQPRKKQRLTGPDEEEDKSSKAVITDLTGATTTTTTTTNEQEQEDAAAAQLEQEKKAGITAWSTDAQGFSGIVKKRYTDFLVNEILLNKHVLHLDDIAKPEPRPKKDKKKDEQQKKKSDEDVQAGEGAAAATVPAATENKEQENGNSTGDVAVSAEAKEQATIEARQSAAIAAIPQSDIKVLEDIFGRKTTQELCILYGKVVSKPGKKSRDFNTLQSDIIQDKQKRTDAHINVRRIFKGLIETMTADDNSIQAKACPVAAKSNPRQQDPRGLGDNQPKGKVGWDELGGEYLHFTLYKENKDTMEVLFFIASQLKVAIKNFQFAGTKDRRGVTVQRCAAFRIKAERLQNLNRQLRAARMGGFKYHKHGLELGDLYGNEFTITLRDCIFPGSPSESAARLEHAKAIAHKALTNFQTTGFINYYGLQRFGSFSIGTDEVGKRMLQGDLKGAVELILTYSPAALEASQRLAAAAQNGEAADDDMINKIGQDDMARADALHTWETTGKMGAALDKLPRRFQAENSIIRHLGWVDRKTGEYKRRHDWQGALMGIARNMRLMYVHAYQSLVWNMAAGKRWEEFGSQVVEGDLVIVGEHKDKELKAEEEAPLEDVDADGEVIIRPVGDDAATTLEDKFERARALTKEEAESGKYNIFDLVLPLPGFDVVYPPNSIGQYYKDFMGSERGGKLNPLDMRRKWRDISLSGGYRKLMARPENVSWEVKSYRVDDEQMVQTDLEKLLGLEEANKTRSAAASGYVKEQDEGAADVEMAEEEAAAAAPQKEEASETNKESGEENDKIAVVLKMQLGSSQYATMALRELSKGGAITFKPDFQGSR